MLILFQKIMKPISKLPEDIKATIQKYSEFSEWAIFDSKEDSKEEIKEIEEGLGITLDEMRSIFWKISLPIGLHVILEENIIKSEEENPDFTSLTLYVCDRPPIEGLYRTQELYLVQSLLNSIVITWQNLTSSNSFGIAHITTNFRENFLEDRKKFDFSMNIIQELSKIPCIEDQL